MVNVPRFRALGVAVAGCLVGAAAGGCAAASSNSAAPGSGGTAPGSGAPSLVASDKSNGHTVSLKVGQHLELVLGSTYWTVKGSTVPGVLHQDGPPSKLARPASCPSNIPGLGCVPIRTDFSAVAPGTAVITASRTSCGEAMRCAPSQEHYTLPVVVLKV